MRQEELWESSQGGKNAAQAYWNALGKLRAAWKEVFGEELPTEGNNAMGAFEQAIDLMKSRLASDSVGGKRLRTVLDVDAGDDIAEVLLGWADMGDLPPNVVKLAIREIAKTRSAGRHDLRPILREVFDRLFGNAPTRRPRVGANRHWPRLFQYLRELEDETDWPGFGKGLHLMNAGGGGRVAAEPADPKALAVRLDPELL